MFYGPAGRGRLPYVFLPGSSGKCFFVISSGKPGPHTSALRLDFLDLDPCEPLLGVFYTA
jgi:hypothetical protein